MDMIEIKAAVFNAAILHSCKNLYVTNGLKGDVPVNLKGYLVMVNELGDRVAHCAPGDSWVIASKAIIGYNPNIPNYKNAIAFLFPKPGTN